MTKRWDYELYVDGAWTDEESVGSIDVIDPATEESIGSVPEASRESAVRAIAAARSAFDSGPWPWMKPAGTCRVLGANGRDPREPSQRPSRTHCG